MSWVTHLTIPFLLISIAIAYFIFILIKNPIISKSFLYTSFLILCVSSLLSTLYDFWIVFHWSADTWVHLTLINETINIGLFPGNPFFQNQPTIINYSVIHLICAEIYFFFEIPPHLLLIPLALLAVLLRILFVFVWIRYLLRSEKLALLAISIYVISSGSFFSPTFHFLWYPFSLGITISNLIFLFMLKSLKEDKLKYAFICALFLSIAIMLHIIVGVFLFLAILGFLFFYVILKGVSLKSTYYIIVIFIVGIGLALLWYSWLIPSYLVKTSLSQLTTPNLPPNQALNSNIFRLDQRYITITRFGIVNPGYVLLYVFSNNLVLIGLVVLGFYKFFRNFNIYQATQREVYLMSSTILPVVMSFIPPLFYFLNRLLKGSIVRIMILLPQLFFATIGFEWLCRVVFRKFSHHDFNPKFKNVSRNLSLFLMIFLIIGISSYPKYDYYLHRDTERESTPLVLDWASDFTWLKEHSAKDSIVLSDPWTSYFIPYFAERKIVATHQSHATSFSISTGERISDVVLVLNASTSLRETLTIIKKYNVSYILLNLRPYFNYRYSNYRPHIENYYSLETPLKFCSSSTFFKKVYYFDGVWVFEVMRSDVSN